MISLQSMGGVSTIVFLCSTGLIIAEPTSEAPARVSSDSVGQLVEIVVTAEKRSSTVQKTPISMTALSGEELQKLGVTGAQSLAQIVPGIAVASAGPGQAQYEIRGVSADGGEAPTVGFYLDEVPITPPTTASIGKSAIDPDLYDLARVEVLRGPQGTLYGAGSMGGTIKLVPAPPDMSGFYGSAQSMASGTQGGGLNYSEKAMLNMPLAAETLALRIVGSYGQTSGWIDRVVVPDFPLETNPGSVYGTTRGNVLGIAGSQIFHNVNDEKLTAGRVQLLFTPIEALSISPSILYQRITQSGMNTYDSSPGTLAHYQPFDISEPFSDTFTLYSFTVNYSTDIFHVTSATGYWTRSSRQRQDASEVTQNVFSLPGYGVADGGIGAAAGNEIDNTRQFSEELRISSVDNATFQWLAGGFYSRYHFNQDISETAPGILLSQGSPFATDNIFHVSAPQAIRQGAIFGNVSYVFSDLFKATLGGRYFTFRNSIDASDSGIASATGTDVPTYSAGAASASGFNPMANIEYTPSSDVMYYLTAAKGFREGAGNFPIPNTGPIGSVCLQNLQAIGRTSSPLMYGPDQVWSYELGEKARFLEQRITVNADVFYLKWSKVQQPVALACGFGFVENAGTAAVKGGELEVRVLLLPSLTLSQNIGFSNASFTQDVAEAGIVKGQNLFNVPRWTVSTELRYEHPVASGLRGSASVTNSYVSSSQDLTYLVNTLPARDLTGLRLGVEAKSWAATLFADNLLNRHYPIEYIGLITFTGPPYNRIANIQPRTVGVNFDVKF